ncbi:MAG: hypothetical protein ACO2ZL_00605 [Flavobacteriales bacterium]
MIKALAYTHIWIALGAGSAAAASMLATAPDLANGTAALQGIALLTAFTGLAYTVQRMVKLHRHPHRIPQQRKQFLSTWRWPLMLGWSAALALAFALAFPALGYWWSWMHENLILIGGIFILTWGYASNPFTGGRGWREVPRAKWPAIALVWGVSTGWMPLDWVEASVDDSVRWFNLVAQTAFVAGITLPFDVRDVGIDDDALKTMPQVVGLRSSGLLALGLVVISGLLFLSIDPGWGRVTASGFALVGIALSMRNSNEWVCSLWLDGCLVLQGVLAFLAYSAGF